METITGLLVPQSNTTELIRMYGLGTSLVEAVLSRPT